MTPNIPRPRSRGRLYLTSADPNVKPALDFRYFTDPEGYDAATLVYGVKAARKIAETAPFKDWIKREVAPGPAVQTQEELEKYVIDNFQTVFHPVSTATMLPREDGGVVDATLKVYGTANVRVVSGMRIHVFTTMLTERRRMPR